MNQEDILKTQEVVLTEIKNARKYSELPSPDDLFISSETIISGLASLIGPLMQFETAYRQKIRNYMEIGDSHAKAEGKAQAEEEYQAWKKLKYVYDLAGEQIMIIKKFSGQLGSEYKRY